MSLRQSLAHQRNPEEFQVADRLQKALANAGLASRREAETWIRAGRVSVNGEVAELGRKVESGDKVTLDGRQVLGSDKDPAKPQYLKYHKPAGEICTRKDDQGRRTVFQSLPKLRGARWVAVGRLDINTSGLMLFSTDGAFANQLMHPSTGLLRRYLVRVQGTPSDKDLESLQTGVELDDGPAKFESIQRRGSGSTNNWFEVELGEGRNREVRRLWEAVGFRVSRLSRIAYGPIVLDKSLHRGKSAALATTELDMLKKAIKNNRK